jgi:hypothetical protein
VLGGEISLGMCERGERGGGKEGKGERWIGIAQHDNTPRGVAVTSRSITNAATYQAKMWIPSFYLPCSKYKHEGY